ncbi:MAG: SMI1/KNR4 family protein [Pseudomonadota bacterium]|nr:SMI1/KNR4 family protein [Pseudomonadota bacterium]
MSSNDITPLADGIVAHLRHLGRKSPDLLQPPLPSPAFATCAAKFPFPLTGELLAIYAWRNGTRAEQGESLENLHFFPGFFLLSLEDALRNYLERKQNTQWRDDWFPLFADDAGDFYVVPCGSVGVDSTEVIGFVHGEPTQVAEYESIAAMLRTLNAAFAEGVFFVDHDGSLEMDDDKYKLLARRFNPKIDEWQD